MGMWKSERWPRYGKNTFPNVIVSPLPHLLPSPYSPYFHSLDRSEKYRRHRLSPDTNSHLRLLSISLASCLTGCMLHPHGHMYCKYQTHGHTALGHLWLPGCRVRVLHPTFRCILFKGSQPWGCDLGKQGRWKFQSVLHSCHWAFSVLAWHVWL